MAGNFPATLSSTLSSIPNPPPKSTNQHPKPPKVISPLHLHHQTLTQGHFRSIISALRSCARACAFEEGRAIHAQVVKTTPTPNPFVAASLVRFYSACGHIDHARQVFDEVAEKDAALETAMLAGYALNGAIVRARRLFDEMPERDLIAWNAMLSAYAQCGLPVDALELFKTMQIANVRPNEVTLVSALSACSQLGYLSIGEWIHAFINRDDNIRMTSTLRNSLVHMYSKCGRLDAAFQMFVETQPRNVESWNTMLTSLAIHGHVTTALALFSQMVKIGVVPDRITFVGLLMACSHGGRVDHANRCFDCMMRIYGMEPKPEHYGCMVDVLSRGGFLEEACMLINDMPFEPDAYMWGALLSGCLTHNSYGLGLLAAKCLLELEPDEESRYISLLNLHAMSGNGEDAMMVRKAMNDRAWKASGRSMIEIDGAVHEFLAGA
ncbi:hypothetical protein ACLOJK_009550 [Asimina triloba]